MVKSSLTALAWTLIVGVLLVRMALFMSYPFLALYLESLHFNALDIGIILGCHYFFGGITGVFGGTIADKWGAKPVLVATLLIGTLSFFGLSQVTGFFAFIFFNSLLAIATSTFEPTASVLITANSPQEKHAYAFRLRYLAINIGAAIGPLMGALLIFYGPAFSFQMTAMLLLLYFVIFLMIKIQNRPQVLQTSGNIRGVLKHMLKNNAFLFLIGANLLVTMTYGQIFSTLPQIINEGVEKGRFFYSVVLTMNPIIVISMSFFLNKFLCRQDKKRLFTVGSLLLMLAFLGFHLSPIELPFYIVFMILFTLAEMALIPTTSKLLFDLAPQEYKSSYLGAESTSYLGFFLGNLIGGVLLQNNLSVFLFCVLCAFSSFFLYREACSREFSLAEK